MDRHAVFVDVGSLLSQIAEALTGSPIRRGIEVDHRPFVAELTTWSTEVTGMPLLRCYWYDGDHPAARTTNERIAVLPDVKVRLGRIVLGKQKGVDGKLARDLGNLARTRGIATAVLIASDGDFIEAVEECQEYGVRVELAALQPTHPTISPELRVAADHPAALGHRRDLVGRRWHGKRRSPDRRTSRFARAHSPSRYRDVRFRP